MKLGSVAFDAKDMRPARWPCWCCSQDPSNLWQEEDWTLSVMVTGEDMQNDESFVLQKRSSSRAVRNMGFNEELVPGAPSLANISESRAATRHASRPQVPPKAPPPLPPEFVSPLSGRVEPQVGGAPPALCNVQEQRLPDVPPGIDQDAVGASPCGDDAQVEEVREARAAQQTPPATTATCATTEDVLAWRKEFPPIDELEPISEDGAVLTPDGQADWSTAARSPPERALVGHGAYGSVWRAKRRGAEERFAVKSLTPQPKTALLHEMLSKRECEISNIIRGTRHPNIVKIFRVIQIDTTLFCIVMELCDSQDLFQKMCGFRIAKGAYQTPREAIFWLGQVFLGLEHLHMSLDLVWLDLKPQNVLFDVDGVVKLTDFGIARAGALQAGGGIAWSAGPVLGTPGYGAPEMLRQEPCSAASDLYSFGVLVFVLLTGGVAGTTGDPYPPMQNPTSAKAASEDWQLLRQCVEKPNKYGVASLPNAAAKDFVLKLAVPEKERRPSHAELRASQLLSILKLPPFDASFDESHAWSRTGFTSSGMDDGGAPSASPKGDRRSAALFKIFGGKK